MSSLRPILTAFVATLALTLAACGGDDSGEKGSEASPPAETTEAQAPAETTPAEGGEGKVGEVSKDLEEKPSIPQPEGEPPTELQTKDIVEGKGTTAKKGDNVSVQYVGVNWSNGAEFDASWNSGQAFTFTLGSGNVIAGWDEGVAGMKEGGRRMLIIPPDKGYGPAGSPPAIGPDETLVFVVDLEKVTRGQG